MDAPIYPKYYETATSSVMLISRYKAVILYMQPTSPKVSFVDSRAVTQEQRNYDGKRYMRLITAEEFKNRFFIVEQLKTAISGVILPQNGENFITAELSEITLRKVATQGVDRYKYLSTLPVTLTTETQSYDGMLEVYINRFGELRYGTLFFSEPVTTEWGIAMKIGVNGYVFTGLTSQELIAQNYLDEIEIDIIKSFLYVYPIGGVAAPNSFNNSFNLSFETI